MLPADPSSLPAESTPDGPPRIPPPGGPVPPPAPFRARLRDSALFCAVVTVLATGLLGCCLLWISVGIFQSYGWTVFVFSPGICSFFAVVLHRWARPGADERLAPITWAVLGVLAVLVSLGLLLASAGEGLICVLMALPFAIVMAFIGAGLGQIAVTVLGPSRPLPVLTLALLLFPGAQAYEQRYPAPVPARQVVTRREVNASPERVWAALVQPVTYPRATGWFRAGVVYPTRTAFARDSVTGRPMLVCHYSQGLARLPVVVWDPAQELTFAVPAPDMPAPMRELSPYPKLHAPHLHGYFRVDSGTFRLRPLPGGRTLLEARTVYRHSIGPPAYWQLWSDYLLDALHARVLATIGTQAEQVHE